MELTDEECDRIINEGIKKIKERGKDEKLSEEFKKKLIKKLEQYYKEG